MTEQRGSWEKAQDWKGRIERGKEMIGQPVRIEKLMSGSNSNTEEQLH